MLVSETYFTSHPKKREIRTGRIYGKANIAKYYKWYNLDGGYMNAHCVFLPTFLHV